MDAKEYLDFIRGKIESKIKKFCCPICGGDNFSTFLAGNITPVLREENANETGVAVFFGPKCTNCGFFSLLDPASILTEEENIFYWSFIYENFFAIDFPTDFEDNGVLEEEENQEHETE
ncbi:MAG: hypothetical protein N3A54_02545 [Patescibacteria group bacterium]|nr:hypothetical protein [Patescibacteria group bacterium]